ncbi:hypothetical protein PMAYCL1PPCAC_10549 [Pristionchus mayeri]|uniref:Uncharacterized protein n=1 Tax=Pristionchus mayeri TaxID=1317129 RepID=A0AAN5CET8_9BILA|nr:hypothetical protein PMAYCL1PPCAC_10549 [Pristionchus mayeri]
MSLPTLIKEVKESVEDTLEKTLERLSNRMPIVQIRAFCEPDTLMVLEVIRIIRTSFELIDDSAHPLKAFIPELEEIIAIGERILELVRPRGA